MIMIIWEGWAVLPTITPSWRLDELFCENQDAPEPVELSSGSDLGYHPPEHHLRPLWIMMNIIIWSSSYDDHNVLLPAVLISLREQQLCWGEAHQSAAQYPPTHQYPPVPTTSSPTMELASCPSALSSWKVPTHHPPTSQCHQPSTFEAKSICFMGFSGGVAHQRMATFSRAHDSGSPIGEWVHQALSYATTTWIHMTTPLLLPRSYWWTLECPEMNLPFQVLYPHI